MKTKGAEKEFSCIEIYNGIPRSTACTTKPKVVDYRTAETDGPGHLPRSGPLNRNWSRIVEYRRRFMRGSDKRDQRSIVPDGNRCSLRNWELEPLGVDARSQHEIQREAGIGSDCVLSVDARVDGDQTPSRIAVSQLPVCAGPHRCMNSREREAERTRSTR